MLSGIFTETMLTTLPLSTCDIVQTGITSTPLSHTHTLLCIQGAADFEESIQAVLHEEPKLKDGLVGALQLAKQKGY